MKTIRVADSGVIDLTEKIEIDKILEAFASNDDKEILLDLDGCFISYDTSYFLDSVISKITDKTTEKTIRLKTDYRFISAETMWDWLLRDSSLFNDDEVSENENFNVIECVKSKYNVNLVEDTSDEY